MSSLESDFKRLKSKYSRRRNDVNRKAEIMQAIDAIKIQLAAYRWCVILMALSFEFGETVH